LSVSSDACSLFAWGESNALPPKLNQNPVVRHVTCTR